MSQPPKLRNLGKNNNNYGWCTSIEERVIRRIPRGRVTKGTFCRGYPESCHGGVGGCIFSRPNVFCTVLELLNCGNYIGFSMWYLFLRACFVSGLLAHTTHKRLLVGWCANEWLIVIMFRAWQIELRGHVTRELRNLCCIPSARDDFTHFYKKTLSERRTL